MTDKKAAKLEKHLLKTQFPEECKEIPQEHLSEDEKYVINKCINHEEFDEDEFILLKRTLQKYRKAIKKHKPNETIEAVDRTEEMILT